MVKAEWGVKRTCQECGAKFYDMRRNPILCPKCGAAFEPQTGVKTRMRRPGPVEEEKPARKPAPPPPRPEEPEAPAAAEPEKPETEEEEEEELIEDASELGEDEEDMAEVIEGVGKEDEPA